MTNRELFNLDSYLREKPLLFLMKMPVAISMLRKEKTHDMYLSLARDAASKSRCFKRQVGAIIVKKGKILSTGHNGVPFDIFDCAHERLCGNNANSVWYNGGVSPAGCKALCAEQMAIVNAARRGIEIAGATLYTNFSPCLKCAMAIVAANIAKVVYEQDYQDDLAVKFLERAGVIIWKHS